MEHPIPIHPRDHAVYSPDRMSKSTIFRSEHVMVGLNAFEPGQEHALHAHEGMDKVYHVIEGEGLFCSKPATCRCRLASCWSHLKACLTVSAIPVRAGCLSSPYSHRPRSQCVVSCRPFGRRGRYVDWLGPAPAGADWTASCAQTPGRGPAQQANRSLRDLQRWSAANIA